MVNCVFLLFYCILVILKSIYLMNNRDNTMKDLNDVQKKEIRIKQDRLRALINIDSLLLDSPNGKANKDIIRDYTSHEKNSLLIDILNSLNIKEYDTSFYEENGGSGYKVDCTVEASINHINEYYRLDTPVINTLYNELVLAIANYDIEDLVDYEIISGYLKMISLSILCYEDIEFESCTKIG